MKTFFNLLIDLSKPSKRIGEKLLPMKYTNKRYLRESEFLKGFLKPVVVVPKRKKMFY